MTLKEFTNFASKNNMMVISTDIYSKMLDDTVTLAKYKKVLPEIRAEIDSHCSDNRDRNDGLYIAMKIIDKHLKDFNA